MNGSSTTIIKERLMEGRGYVYALRDPRNRECFYVGVTVNPWARLEGHRKPENASSAELGRYVTAMLSEGVEPEMVLLEKTDFSKLLDRENHHIDRLRSEGASLLNIKRNREGGAYGRTVTDVEYEEVVQELRGGADPRAVGKRRALSSSLLADLKRELAAAS